MTSLLKTANNAAPRKTLAQQLDRLDSILDGLDSALAGAVQEAVGQAVKQAVQAVLTEVMAQRELREQLGRARNDTVQQAVQSSNWWQRGWQALTDPVARMVQKLAAIRRHAGLLLLSAGGLATGLVSTARRRLGAVVALLWRRSKSVAWRTLTALRGLLPPLATAGI